MPISGRRRAILALQVLLIVGGTWFVFLPVFHGSWQWDDNVDLLQNRSVHDPAGLWKIWFASDNVDYFPLKATVNWFQWRLWGSDPFGYHLTNVALHALSALLFWRLLARCGLKGAWWAGLLFAVHPLAVESVAWVAELKNTLSLPPLLLAMTAYVEFDSAEGAAAGRARRRYWLALSCFLAALLCKTSAVMFPVILLLYAGWRHGRIRRRDLWASLPFFALSLLFGGITVWFQSHGTDVGTAAASAGLGHRLIEAGQNLGFYFRQCLWPVNPMPLYPQRPLGLAGPWLLLPWGAMAAALGWLWAKRASYGAPMLFGLGWFALNLLPVLGIVPMSFQRYAPVSDHLVYLPLLGIIGLVVGGMALLAERLPSRSRPWAAAGALAICGLLAGRSRQYARDFRDGESLWTYALQHNPGAWVAHVNLGVAWAAAGRNPEAIGQFEEALRLKPDDPNAQYSLGNALRDTGRWPEAIVHYQEAIRFRPNFPEAENNLASVLADAGQWAEALPHYQAALQLNPDNAEVQNNFGNALRQAGRGGEAIAHYEAALRLRPDLPAVHFNLALSLADAGRWSEAIGQCQRTLELQPNFPDAADELARLQAAQPR